MSDTPKISVIIPAYNRAAELPRALASVQAQDFPDMEILIVDDGSKDNTIELMEAYAARDPRVRLIRHEKNSGEAAARNTGVRSARGEYIAFLDSDDEWLPGKLHAQVAAFEAAPADVAAVVTGQRLVREDGGVEEVSDWSNGLPITSYNLLSRGCGIGMGNTCMVRRAVYDEIGYYDETMPIFVDLDWLCRVTDRYRILKLRDIYTQYYKAVMRSGAFMENGVRVFYDRRSDYLKTFSAEQQVVIRSQFYNYIALAYAANGPWRNFVIARLRQFAIHPAQTLGNYLHFILVLLGVWRVGSSGAKGLVKLRK